MLRFYVNQRNENNAILKAKAKKIFELNLLDLKKLRPQMYFIEKQQKKIT